MNTPRLVRRATLLALVLLASLGLVACGSQPATSAAPLAAAEINVQNASTTPASSPTVPPPSPTLSPSPTPLPQEIFIDSPPSGTLVGSPVQLAGRTTRMPVGGQLGYQVLNAKGQVIGTGTVGVRSLTAGSGVFDAPLTFNVPPDGGNITAQLFEGSADGSIVAVSGVDMFVQSQSQSISIDTPPPGTQVGSPVVLTGKLARLPSQRRLSYLVINSRQQQIGAGTFDVAGEPGRPAGYVGSLAFELPFDGDTVAVQIYDQDSSSGAVVASRSINLYVAPMPQQILIDTPPMGTIVGSPIVVTGRTVRFPFNGTLSYRFTDAGGAQIGAGTFTVAGNVTAGTQFNTQAILNLPRDGGLVRLTIYDQDPANGAVRASKSLDLDVLAQYQAITIDTPLANTQVGSPVVLTGRTNLYPNKGQLRYRVLDDRDTEIGSGSFQVAGAPGARGSFNTSLTFAEPPKGGNIHVELVDQADNGNLIARAVVPLVVAPPPPPQILIDTPAPGTQVGSPVVITGRVTYIPSNGLLTYSVRDAAGTIVGQGNVRATADGRKARFNATLIFTEPALGGNIVVQIAGPSPVAGATPSTSITLYVAPKAQPPRP